MIFTQLHCDSPLFIKTEGKSFKQTYKDFISRKTYTSSFHVNPKPLKFQQITLTPNKLNTLFEKNIIRSPDIYEIHPLFVSVKDNSGYKNMDLFLSPLLFAYNNIDFKVPIGVLGYPYLVEIDYWAKTIKPNKMLSLYHEGKTRGDMRVVFDKFFDEHRSQYMKYRNMFSYRMLLESSYYYNEILAFVDYRDIDGIASQFKNRPNQAAISPDKLVSINEHSFPKIEFTSYLTNVIILDAVYERFLYEYFWPNKLFPYEIGDNFIGSDYGIVYIETLINHFKEQYVTNLVHKKKPIDDVEGLEMMFKDKIKEKEADSDDEEMFA